MTAPELSTGPKGFKIQWPNCPLCNAEMRIVQEKESPHLGWRYCTDSKCFWNEANPLEMDAARKVCASIRELRLEIRNLKEETRNFAGDRESTAALLNEAQDEAEEATKQTAAMREERDKANYISALHCTKESTELVETITDLKAKVDYARNFGLLLGIAKSSDCPEGRLAADTLKGSTLHRLEEGIVELIDAEHTRDRLTAHIEQAEAQRDRLLAENEKATKDADNLRASERAADAHIGELRETIDDLKNVIEGGIQDIGSAAQDVKEAEAFGLAAMRDAFEEGLRADEDPGACPPSHEMIERLWTESEVFKGLNDADRIEAALVEPPKEEEPKKENGGNEGPIVHFT